MLYIKLIAERNGEKMKRVLLDTNIYGEIAIDTHLELLREKVVSGEKAIFYGLDVVRKELRATPTSKKIGGKSLRILLLSLYDSIIRHEILAAREAEELAEHYFNVYSELGGIKSKDDIRKDFIIVACASIKKLDVVVSNDEKSMLSETALKAYAIVNGIKKIPEPDFIPYKDFRRWFV